MSTFKSLSEYDFSAYRTSDKPLYVLCFATLPPLLIHPQDGKPLPFSELMAGVGDVRKTHRPLTIVQVAGPTRKRLSSRGVTGPGRSRAKLRLVPG